MFASLALTGLALCPCTTPAQGAGGEKVVRRLGAMGTYLTVEVEASGRDEALQASEMAIRAIERTEKRLSTWRPSSELTRLNSTPTGDELLLSAELTTELGEARRIWKETGGAFDPGIGALVQAFDLRGEGREPEPDEWSLARSHSGLDQLGWEQDGVITRVKRKTPGFAIEEGAFGKGAGIDRALESLRGGPAVRVVIDLGGQVAVLPGARALPHSVPLAHPDRREEPVLEISIQSGSIATTGNSERGLQVEGERLSHILDPRTARPAVDFGSLTVHCSSALEADALSTGLYVMGPEAALDFAFAREGLEVLVMERTPDGLRLRVTPGLAATVKPLTPRLSVEIHPSPPPAIPPDHP